MFPRCICEIMSNDDNTVLKYCSCSMENWIYKATIEDKIATGNKILLLVFYVWFKEERY